MSRKNNNNRRGEVVVIIFSSWQFSHFLPPLPLSPYKQSDLDKDEVGDREKDLQDEIEGLKFQLLRERANKAMSTAAVMDLKDKMKCVLTFDALLTNTEPTDTHTFTLSSLSFSLVAGFLLLIKQEAGAGVDGEGW